MAPPHEKIGDLIYFRNVDSFTEGGVLAIGWRFTDKSDDPWTTRFNAVKAGDLRSIRAAQATLVHAVKGFTFGRAGLGLVVGAISSSKDHLESKDPVWQLGASIAGALHVSWRPDVLKKKPHKSLHYLNSAAERAAEVKGVYSASEFAGNCSVLIVDDFVTRGDTFADIARALKSAVAGPVTVYGLALAKTENLAFPPNFGISNNHVPLDLEQIWDKVQ